MRVQAEWVSAAWAHNQYDEVLSHYDEVSRHARDSVDPHSEHAAEYLAAEVLRRTGKTAQSRLLLETMRPRRGTGSGSGLGRFGAFSPWRAPG
jgi:hypothetical protein